MSSPLHIQAQLKQAFDLLNSGRTADAKALGARILKAAPRDPNALYLMGVLAHQAGDLKDAAKFFEKSHAADRRNPTALSGIGIVRIDQGRFAEAAKIFEQLRVLMPREAVVLNNLGICHKGLRRFDKAIPNFEAAIAARPDYADAYANLGGLLVALGELDRAVGLLRDAVARCRPDPSLWLNLADALMARDESEDAMDVLSRGVADFPTHREIRSRLASIMVNKGDFDAARAALTTLIEEDPNDASALFDMADLVEARPEPGDDSTEVLRRRGLEAFRKSGATDPPPVLAHRMAQASEALKDFDAAFRYYEAAQSAFRVGLRSVGKTYDRAETEREIDLLIAHFDAVPLPDAAPRDGAPSTDRPIFIVGMPRSGSSLLEQVLASHPEIAGGGELLILPQLIEARMKGNADDRGRGAASVAETIIGFSDADTQEIRNAYAKALLEVDSSARFVTDKLPTNFINVGLIRQMFPRAMILVSDRHPMDICWSIFVQKFSTDLVYDHDLGDIGHYYRQYERLTGFWRERDASVRAVRYEDMVADLAETILPTLERLGLTWDPAMARFFENEREVKTASRLQVRRPIYSSSVARWKRFEDKLGSLLTALGDAPARYEAAGIEDIGFSESGAKGR